MILSKQCAAQECELKVLARTQAMQRGEDGVSLVNGKFAASKEVILGSGRREGWCGGEGRQRG